MASETPKPPREAMEHQDASIKVRKSQLFEKEQAATATVVRPFADYLKSTPPSPISPGIKAALWATAVLVGLLFLAALMFGRGRGPAPRHASPHSPVEARSLA